MKEISFLLSFTLCFIISSLGIGSNSQQVLITKGKSNIFSSGECEDDERQKKEIAVPIKVTILRRRIVFVEYLKQIMSAKTN